MSELIGRNFLRALLHAGQRMRLHPDGHRSVDDALAALERAADVLTSAGEEATVTVLDGSFYLGQDMLPHATLEFNGLLSELEARSIDSITMLPGPEAQDLVDLASLVAGVSSDLPVGGTIRLNERPLTPADLREVPVSGLRRTYASSLEALRNVSEGGRLELGGVMDVVSGFVAGDSRPSLMIATIHNHDETTFYHSVNVCLLSLALGRAIGLDDELLRHLGTGALLHDLGRVILDEAALTKEGRLTNEEWAQVRLHPQEGAQAILAASGPGQEVAAVIALEHHLRLDGDGYPDLGRRLPHLFSRIVSVADTYDAITSPRPHRPARTPHEALRIIHDGAGTAYDPDIARAFLHVMGTYPPGSLVRLETGEVVMVTPAHAGSDTQPGVVVRDPSGALLDEPEPIELTGRTIVDHLLADEAGIDPAALLEVVDGAA
jgi:HD-GYP domain-containing protein (c-di-GMP phosphodiesterase class II)